MEKPPFLSRKIHYPSLLGTVIRIPTASDSGLPGARRRRRWGLERLRAGEGVKARPGATSSNDLRP